MSLTPEEYAMIADIAKKTNDVHTYVFSSERGRKRPARSEEIDALLDGTRYGKWTLKIILYLAGLIAAIGAAYATVKGGFK